MQSFMILQYSSWEIGRFVIRQVLSAIFSQYRSADQGESIRVLARPLADPGTPDKVTRAVQEGPTVYGAQGDY